MVPASKAQETRSPGSVAPASPAACVQDITKWRAAQMSAAREAYNGPRTTVSARSARQAQYAETTRTAERRARSMATTCAANFPAAVAPVTQLPQLVELLTLAGDRVGVRIALTRLVADNSLPPRARAMGLLLGLTGSGGVSSAVGTPVEAERLVGQLDQLPDSLADIRLQAHKNLLRRYEQAGLAVNSEKEARAVIALSQIVGNSTGLPSAYLSLVTSFSDRFEVDSALSVVETAERLFGALGVSMFADLRKRYALVGTRAKAIQGDLWINTDRPTVLAPISGRVMLIEFTAHWCSPCVSSYPALRALAAKFRGEAFDGVLATKLYGYLGDQTDLTAEQEIAADRDYFGKQHNLPFPVVITRTNHSGAPGVSQTEIDYQSSAVPHFVIVDKRGVIRFVGTGWDSGNAERLQTHIAQLLAEKP